MQAQTLGEQADGMQDGSDGLRKKTEKRIMALELLSASLKELLDSELLRDLVTIVDCPQCSSTPGVWHGDCLRDILIYNLPLGLLTALERFRDDYFDDTDLPEPLRWSAIEKYGEEFEEHRKKREEKRQRQAPL